MESFRRAGIVGLLAFRAGLAEAQTTQDYPTAISDCQIHDSTPLCMYGATEYEVVLPASATTTAIPDIYDDCHQHGNELFCVDPQGNDVEIHKSGAEEEHDHEDQEDDAASTSSSELTCHFHAGVEHCTGGNESEATEASCERTDRDYNIPLRIGLLFVILATSALGVFGPIYLQKALPSKMNCVFTILKQFGTGVIVSTAFVHLYTHATLMFDNKCLVDYIHYESTSSAVVMAGLFISFLVEYAGQRFVQHKAQKADEGFNLQEKTQMIKIMVMEAGVVFHSLLIGLTLVVAGDSFFKTLFIVILFHQMFEGIALGSRIAALGTIISLPTHKESHGNLDAHTRSAAISPGKFSSNEEDRKTQSITDQQSNEAVSSIVPVNITSTVPLRKKLYLASAFAIITPLGMAIGIGVLDRFNGNDPATLITIGTLDALSAGILIWVGLVEMWAADWMMGGELTNASPLITILGLFGLVGGMALMSLLGKWA